MQGQLIIGAILAMAMASPSIAASESVAANDPIRRQTCAKGEQPQPVQQPQTRQQWAQLQQQRHKPQGCPMTRSIPSVVDPTPTFLL